MLLSVIICGKNDNHRKNTFQTLKLNLEQTLTNIHEIECDDVELVLCDWGSEIKITDAIPLDKHKNFKCVYVSPEIAQKYNGKSSYSIVHSLNTAFRHTTGKYVIFWNSDCFVEKESFSNLYNFVKHMDAQEDMSFYWASRYNIPYEQYASFETCEEVNSYIQNNKNIPHQSMAKSAQESFVGCGASILMNRNMWESSTGWWEKLPYWGWQDIEFHNRLLQKYNYGGDIHDAGVKIYHFDYPHDPSFINEYISSDKFDVNDPSWGLKDEVLEIY